MELDGRDRNGDRHRTTSLTIRANNLKLNCQKSKEIIFRAHGVRGKSVQLPPPCQSIERTDKLTVLGVVINDHMTAVDHVGYLQSSCSSLLYMLRTVRNHDTPEASLKDIFRATVMAKILYCAPAWSVICSAADQAKLDAFLRRCKRSGYCELSVPTMAELFTDADDAYFLRIHSNKNHVL